MNTHTDGLYGNTYKENTLVKLESAMPAVDQPSRWVDGREIKEMLCSTSPCKLWSTAATLFTDMLTQIYIVHTFPVNCKQTNVFVSTFKF
jgi:hypothetical protein